MSRARWARSFGPYGCRVRVYETATGIIYAESRVKGVKKGRRESLGHRDRARAAAWAAQRQAELKLGVIVLDTERPTSARVFGAYLLARTPLKRSANTQQQDRRTAAMWQRVLGDAFDLSKLGHDELDRFQMDRASGAIDASGKPVPKLEDRVPVRARAIAADLELLRAVLRWAHALPPGRKFLHDNPMQGYHLPREANPRRPVASQDRYEQLRAVADQVHPFFGEILDLANETGRRISAVLGLRYHDLRLSDGTRGAIVWPADTDKMGTPWAAPLSAPARAAVDQILATRPGIGAVYLFPSPRHAGAPVSRYLAVEWLHRAEGLAELPHDCGGFHAYRRKWGTERKHLPVQDVAAAGGWKSLDVLQRIYQQPDPATLERVVSEPMRLRAAVGHG